MSEPDWENFAKAVLTDWPTGDLDGSVLFDLSLQYGMIQEVPGGYNSDHHIDAEGICPEEGDPWYEYTFRGEAGPGLYSITDMDNRIEELGAKLDWVLVERDETFALMLDRAQTAEAKLAKAVEALNFYATLIGEKHECPWHMLSDDYGEKARNTLAELTGSPDA